MTKVFLTRPVLAAVCSLIILIAGLVVIPTLAIAQYPQIAPPVVTVTATYVGASPQAVEAQVTTPLEQAVNTAQGLRYISSTSAQGVSTITCYVQRSASISTSPPPTCRTSCSRRSASLPQTVQQVGVTGYARTPARSSWASRCTSDNPKYDTLFLSNYAQLNIVNDLSRIPGVSQVRIFGQRQYAMRIWLNPDQARRRRASTPATSSTRCRSRTPRSPPAASAPRRVAQSAATPIRSTRSRSSRRPTSSATSSCARTPTAASRAWATSRASSSARRTTRIALRFDGNDKSSAWACSSTRRQRAAVSQRLVMPKMDAASKAISRRASTTRSHSIRRLRARIDQGSRQHARCSRSSSSFWSSSSSCRIPKSTLIPAATIPVSLIGAFFVMKIFGFTINTITLFGLTLATGLVVDDAIVVIENIARHMEAEQDGGQRHRATPRRCARFRAPSSHRRWCCFPVFIPVAFFPGTTGQLYKQFALTIAAAITISLFQALTLAPVLSARLLTGETESNRFVFFRWFNAGLHASAIGMRELPRAVSPCAGRWSASSRSRSASRSAVPHDADGFIPERRSRLLHHARASAGRHVA